MSVKGAPGSTDRMEPAKCSSALYMIYIMAPSHVVVAVVLGPLLRIKETFISYLVYEPSCWKFPLTHPAGYFVFKVDKILSTRKTLTLIRLCLYVEYRHIDPRPHLLTSLPHHYIYHQCLVMTEHNICIKRWTWETGCSLTDGCFSSEAVGKNYKRQIFNVINSHMFRSQCLMRRPASLNPCFYQMTPFWFVPTY